MQTNLYSKVTARIDELEPELIETAKFIHSNPELGMQEYKASSFLCDILQEHGFNVTRGVAGIETSFVAEIGDKKARPAVAFICEYDALPDVGHACGHNLIAASGLGAGLGLKAVFDELKQGRIMVVGTPAEETENCKLPMVRAGVFDNVDAAMMMHPSSSNYVQKKALAIIPVTVEFFGKSAHAAASPDVGINALDAMILFFNSISLLRQQLPDDVRIHGIITEGGKARNIIPDYTRAEFLVRSVDTRILFETLEKVTACANGAAISTGARVEVEADKDKMLYDVKADPKLVELFSKHLQSMGIEARYNNENTHLGSTDMGNVSHAVPSIHPYLSISDIRIPSHSHEFCQAAISPKGLKAMITGAKVLALTGLDVLLGN